MQRGVEVKRRERVALRRERMGVRMGAKVGEARTAGKMGRVAVVSSIGRGNGSSGPVFREEGSC